MLTRVGNSAVVQDIVISETDLKFNRVPSHWFMRLLLAKRVFLQVSFHYQVVR